MALFCLRLILCCTYENCISRMRYSVFVVEAKFSIELHKPDTVRHTLVKKTSSSPDSAMPIVIFLSARQAILVRGGF